MTFFNRVKNTVTGSGTGTLTLGAAESGFVSAAARYASAEQFVAVIQQDDAWEISAVSHDGSGVLTRHAVIESSNSDVAVDFPAGDKLLFVSRVEPDRTVTAPPTNTEGVLKGFASGAMLFEPGTSGGAADGADTLWVLTHPEGPNLARWTPLLTARRVGVGGPLGGGLVLGGGKNNAASWTGGAGSSGVVLGGDYNWAGAHYSVAFGIGAMTPGRGTYVHGGGGEWASSPSGGHFTFDRHAVGGAQAVYGVTTDDTPRRIGFDGSTTQGLYPEAGCICVEGTVVAYEPATNDTKEWSVRALVRQDTGYSTVDFVGTPSVSSAFATAGAAAWDVDLVINSDQVLVEATGEAAHEIVWGGYLRFTMLVAYE